MPFLPRELDLICAQALPWRSCGGKGGGQGQRGGLLAASMKVLVEVLGSLFPSHAISSSTLAAYVGFTPGHVAVWAVRVGCSFLLQLGLQT